MKKTLLIIAALFVIGAANAQTDLIISEYLEGWSNNKALELYNPTAAAINLSAYQVVRYSNGSDAPPATGNALIVLPDYTLEPYKACVLVLDKRVATGTGQEAPIWSQLEERADLFLCPDYNTSKSLYFNGNDCVTLEKTDGTMVDIFAFWGAPMTSSSDGWTTEASQGYLAGGVVITADHTLVRKSSVTSGVTVSPNPVFNALAEYDSLPANTFENLGWHAFDGAPANNAPTLDLDSVYFVSPFAEEGDVVMTLEGQDADAGQTLEYYLVSGNFIYIGEGDDAVRHEPFAIEKSTGKITVVDELAIADAADDIWMNVTVCDEYAQSEVMSFKIRASDEAALNHAQVIEASITPNPAQNQFMVEAAAVISYVQVLSLAGNEIFMQEVNAKTVVVDINLPTGAYMVKSTFADNSIAVDKLIVE
ncbi:MAG: lamin tail domain-containing protein [Bacteroidales bacterium]|jgi:hypothetical protein|nr:lamin tail domain-containing protein [Bacteroidales bacterium]